MESDFLYPEYALTNFVPGDDLPALCCRNFAGVYFGLFRFPVIVSMVGGKDITYKTSDEPGGLQYSLGCLALCQVSASWVAEIGQPSRLSSLCLSGARHCIVAS